MFISGLRVLFSADAHHSDKVGEGREKRHEFSYCFSESYLLKLGGTFGYDNEVDTLREACLVESEKLSYDPFYTVAYNSAACFAGHSKAEPP